MRFTIPQFIEHEAKIIGPLTFKQFTFLGIAGAICFVLYFTVPTIIFWVATILLGTIALAFAFVKVNNVPLPILLLNSINYAFSPKVYLWGEDKKGDVKIEKEKPSEDELPLKIDGGSRLKNIKNQVETKLK